MASVTPCKNTRTFFESGTPEQFKWILEQYDQCLRIKAENKSQRPENVIKLDKWYQNELPKKIKSRGKDAHLVHEELVQTIKWKLARGKFRPNLTNLVQMNTPRVVMQETKKGLRKIYKNEDLQGAVQALSNLKGCGPAMASAILAAGAPHIAPFMADEILLALPEVDCLDYTMKEYMRMVEHVNACVERLNAGGGEWTPHKVELAIWTYYIANDLKPEILEGMPSANGTPAESKDKAAAADNNGEEKKEEPATASNGAAAAAAQSEEDSNLSAAGTTEDSNMSAASTGDEASNDTNGKQESNAAEEAAPKNGGAESEEKTNGNNAAADAKENGSSSTPAAPESSSAPSTDAAEAENPSNNKTSEIHSEENTSDSTKENQEGTLTGIKRPAEANDDNAQEAPAAAGEAAAAEENTGDKNSEAEPAAKKLKTDEEAPAAPVPAV